MGIQESIKNAALTAGALAPIPSNAPGQYADKQTEYFSGETKAFTQEYAKYSSTYFSARVQGLNEREPLAWQTRMIRLADIVRPSAALLRRADDYKMALFADRSVQYLRPGTKLEVMGSTWLVTNPFNISGGDGAGIVERCNAVWNHLDYYGNVISEPMIVTNRRADANDPDIQASNLIEKGYFNAVMQYNAETAQIDTNTRMILGTGAYKVTGYSDFLQEFTGDQGSVRLIEFTLRYEQANAELDDMENRVAGGKAFSWDVSMIGTQAIPAGRAAKFYAASRRMGEAVCGTEQYPVSYLWTSSDESVATVDENGTVTVISDGTTVIRAALAQNPAHFAETSVEVTASAAGAVAFTSGVPETIEPYADATLTAAWFDESGAETDEALSWETSGAADGTYLTFFTPKSCTVYCFGYSETPLTVTVRHGEYSASAEIRLEGL